MKGSEWVAIATAATGLVGALIKLFWQHRRRKRNRIAVVTQGMPWHGEPAVIVHGWMEEDGTFTPNKKLCSDLRR